MAKLVFSYSHADEALRNELEKHLAPLKRQGLIETWHDRRIIAGQEFDREIGRHFAEADIVLLLISPDFINSDYCYDIEMVQSLERHHAGQAVVIPVILRLCHWHDLPFGKLLAATVDGTPVTQFPTLDEGFYQVVDAIKRALKHLDRPAPRPKALAAMHTAEGRAREEAIVISPTRSSNLRIKRKFTDRERDQARSECIEFVAKYFVNSLDELKQRNSGIDTDFRRIDANGFEAAIYVGGKKKSMCGIWLGGRQFGGDVLFSSSGVTQNSFNESLSLNDDGYTLGFKPLGMAYYGAKENMLLSFEGVAEYLWDLLIRPLQQ